MKTFLSLLFVSFISAALAQQGALLNDTIYRNLSVTQADSLIQANAGNPDFIIIDLRTALECTNSGIIANAINLDFYNSHTDSIIQAMDHSRRYLIYCQSGGRSGQMFNKMQLWNFKEVYNMLGGMTAWLQAGKPTVPYTVGVEAEAAGMMVPSAYPNPVHSTCTLNIPEGFSGTLYVIDPAGKIVLYGSFIPGDQRIDLSELSSGLYTMRLCNGNFLSTQRIVKQ